MKATPYYTTVPMSVQTQEKKRAEWLPPVAMVRAMKRFVGGQAKPVPLVRCGGAGFGFIRARPVKARHGNAQETVVDGKLGAVMNDVI